MLILMYGCSSLQLMKIPWTFRWNTLKIGPKVDVLVLNHQKNKDPIKLFYIQRECKKKAMIHIELYRKRFFCYLPKFLRWKPIAKTGFKSKNFTKEHMTNYINSLYSINMTQERNDSISVAIFVYMWINPKLRGISLGHKLLELAIDEIKCRKLGDYMLLIHDDNGSGKLIEYYKSYGFKPLFDFIEKSMIIKL